MKLNKLKRIKYFTKSLLELRARGFSAEEVISCANIIAAVENLIVWHKSLSNYIKDDDVYIELNTGHPDMLGKYEIGDIIVQGGVTNGVAKVKQRKSLKKFKTKNGQNTVVRNST